MTKTNTKSKFKQAPMHKSVVMPVDKFFIHSVMFEMGIIPIEDPNADMKRCLDQLPTEDAVKMKRKFRKLWRKALRTKFVNNTTKKHILDRVQKEFGLGSKIVGKRERLMRKKLVLETIWNETIAEKVFNAEHPANNTHENNEIHD